MYYAQALHHMIHDNARVLRKGWNGKGMYIFIIKGWQGTLQHDMPDDWMLL